jgi:1A family penicillin-binding protein
VPVALASPATLPEVRDHIGDTAAIIRSTLAHIGRRIERLHPEDWWQFHQLNRLQAALFIQRASIAAIKLTKVAIGNVAWAGLTTTNTLLFATRKGFEAMRLSADATANFAPPIADDLAVVLRRVRRLLSGLRARQVYLMLASGGLFALVTIGTVTAVSTINSFAQDISSPAALLAKKKTGTVILDRNGQVLFEGYGGQATDVVHLGNLPKALKDATVAAEDPSFYDHPGFSWRATARAAWVDATHHGKIEGGSTLTQQLVKNALLTSDRNYKRKYQEILLAMKIERRYSKDEILEMYLNEIYYGQGSSGVEAASRTYFHKPARDLTLGESALIAGLPLGPSRFDPNFDLDAATGRRDYVLGRMAELGKISKAQADAAKAQPLRLAAAGAPQTAASSENALVVYGKQVNIRAPHFVFYVLDQLRAQYGDDVIEQGGITVHTTLDLSKQAAAENSVRTHIGALGYHHVTNSGLVSLDPATGDVLAMVGSVDYNAPGFGNVNVTLSQLQPGSSFKPIAYATAFKKGWNGSSTVDDAPLVLPNGDGSLYIPQNYDGRFHGRVTLRRALDNSFNIPAIKVLQFAGLHDTIQTAHDLGITSLNDESRYGLSLVLGGGEVRPIDMATVYATFANGGTKVLPRAILSVTDRHGKDITKGTPPAPQRVLDPRIAYMVTSILSDDSSRQPEFPAHGPLTLSGRPVAAKTGTTNDFRDNWTVGFTPQIATAVWVGNNDHTPMNNVDGITGAAPIWHDYMEAALADLPVANFTPPAGISVAKVCSADGGLANPWDASVDEVFLAEAMPTKHCASFNPADQPDHGKPDKHDKNQDSPDSPDTRPVEPPIETPMPNPFKPPRFTPLPNPFQ